MANVGRQASIFAANLQKLGTKITGDVELAIAQSVLLLFTRIMEGTPVDTGYCQSRWRLNAKEKPTSPAQIQFKLGQSVWIRNDCTYVEYLEHGSSNQAPHGMVAVSLSKFNQDFMGTLRRYKII